MFLVLDLEKTSDGTGRWCRAQQQQPRRSEQLMESRDCLFLGTRDQAVQRATKDDQVHARMRRVLQDVLCCKVTELTNQIFDLISAFALCEKLLQPFLGDFVGNAVRISPCPRTSYRFCIGVCRDDPDRDPSNDLYRFHK